MYYRHFDIRFFLSRFVNIVPMRHKFHAYWHELKNNKKKIIKSKKNKEIAKKKKKRKEKKIREKKINV